MASLNTETFEAIVIGAGIMGSSTAYYLSKKFGNKVLLLEQFDFLHKRGSSHGESRIIRRTYSQDHYTILMSPAYELWEEAEEEANFKVFTKTGGLDFGHKDNTGISSIISSCQRFNVDIQVLNPSQIAEKFPAINLPEDYLGVYCPDSGVLNATKAMSMFQLLARQNGAKLRDNVKIVGIVKDGDTFEVETTTHGKFRSKKVVLTAGAWTSKILTNGITCDGKKLTVDLPLNPIETTVSYFSVANPELFDGRSGKFPVFISYEDGLVYGCPAIEYPNMLKCGAYWGPDVDPDRRSFLADQTVQNDVGPFLKKVFKGVSEGPAKTESCMFTMTPDSDFILDKVPGAEGLFVGCGFSGHGFKLAPVVGKILSGFVIDGESPFPAVQKYFKLERFQ